MRRRRRGHRKEIRLVERPRLCATCGDPDCPFHCPWCGLVADDEDPYCETHDPGCPVVTNCYPVSLADATSGFQCFGCPASFTTGDFYSWCKRRTVDPEGEEVEVWVALCLPCAIVFGGSPPDVVP